MRRLRIGAVIALFVLAIAAVAGAQDRDAGPPSVRVRVIRPPEGSLRRGSLAVPPWAVYLGGGLLAVAAAGALVWRATKRR